MDLDVKSSHVTEMYNLKLEKLNFFGTGTNRNMFTTAIQHREFSIFNITAKSDQVGGCKTNSNLVRIIREHRIFQSTFRFFLILSEIFHFRILQ